MATSNVDRLVRSTVKIVAFKDDKPVGSGSGLLMLLKIFGKDDPRHAPVLVTNKHVVAGSDMLRFDAKTSDGKRVITTQAPTAAVVMHDDPDVDLCTVPVNPMIFQAAKDNAAFVSSNDIYDDDRLGKLTAIESVTMIGYPKGLIDNKSLYPIARRGITATPAFARFNDKPDFMIDCACFPGSSGSPVFLMDQGVFTDKENNTQVGKTRFGLLGFLYGGPVLNQQGMIVPEAPPEKLADMVSVPMMMNLGFVVRAEKLIEMFEKIRDIAAPAPELM